MRRRMIIIQTFVLPEKLPEVEGENKISIQDPCHFKRQAKLNSKYSCFTLSVLNPQILRKWFSKHQKPIIHPAGRGQSATFPFSPLTESETFFPGFLQPAAVCTTDYITLVSVLTYIQSYTSHHSDNNLLLQHEYSTCQKL